MFGYHLVNLVIHLSASVLVWHLIMLIFSTPLIKQQKISQQAYLIAFFTSAIFLSHPIQTQAVTYIIQRATSLEALFCLLCLVFYVKSRLLQNKNPKLYIWKLYYIASIITAVIAMFTKEVAVILPSLIVLCEVCFLKTEKSINLKKIAPFLITFAIIPLTMFFTKSVNFREMRLASEPLPGISPPEYLLTQFKVIVTYFRLLFLPLNQNLDYDYPISQSFFEFPTLISFLLLSIILFAAVKVFSKYKIISFSIFWFFLTLLPESGIIPIKDVIFEHRLYLPMAGFSIFMVSIIYYLLENKQIKLIAVLLSAIVICYSILTYARNYVWKDEITLWNDTIRKSPKKARAYSERGNVYKNKGKLDEAMSDFNKAIDLDPAYANAYNNRGIVYLSKGDPDKALKDFNKAIDLNPKVEFNFYNRGNAYKTKGLLNEAIADYTRAIEVNKNFALAYHNRGSAYYELRKLDQAIADYSKAIQIEPNLALTYYNRGNANKELGILDQAIADYSKAIQIEPNLAGAYYNRAIAYFLKQRFDKSWLDLRKLRELGYIVDSKFLEELKKASGLKE